MRQHAAPPEPDSCGIVSAMRLTSAPTMKAPLPLREQPVTPSRLVSMPVAAVPSCSSPSIRRSTPHAHAVSEPAEWLLPKRSKNLPLPRELPPLCAPKSSLPNVMVATVPGIGIDAPPMPMMAGNGPVPDGFLMDDENEMVLLPTVTLTVMLLPLSDASTLSGGGGYTPSSYCCMILLISARRHSKSALVVILVPAALVNGSGSLALLTVGYDAATEHVACRSKISLAGAATANAAPARRRTEDRWTILECGKLGSRVLSECV